MFNWMFCLPFDRVAGGIFQIAILFPSLIKYTIITFKPHVENSNFSFVSMFIEVADDPLVKNSVHTRMLYVI